MGLPAWRDRVEEGERAIQEAGGTLVGVWVTLGRYDVVEVFEAPDDEIALEIITKLQHFGGDHTETLRAFTRGRGGSDHQEAVAVRRAATRLRRSRNLVAEVHAVRFSATVSRRSRM